MNTTGIADIASVKKPRTAQAHWILRLWYMGVTAKGRQTATMDLTVVAADCAEADNCLYASPK